MHLFSLLVYLFSTGIALTILYSSFSLYRKFLLPCLQHYLYFLSAFFVAGFIDLIGNTLGQSFFAGQSAEAVREIGFRASLFPHSLRPFFSSTS